MKIAKCLRNVRCDSGGCKNFAIANLDTNGYKGNICLCKECFESLYKDSNKLRKDLQNNLKNKG